MKHHPGGISNITVLELVVTLHTVESTIRRLPVTFRTLMAVHCNGRSDQLSATVPTY